MGGQLGRIGESSDKGCEGEMGETAKIKAPWVVELKPNIIEAS